MSTIEGLFSNKYSPFKIRTSVTRTSAHPKLLKCHNVFKNLHICNPHICTLNFIFTHPYFLAANE